MIRNSKTSYGNENDEFMEKMAHRLDCLKKEAACDTDESEVLSTEPSNVFRTFSSVGANKSFYSNSIMMNNGEFLPKFVDDDSSSITLQCSEEKVGKMTEKSSINFPQTTVMGHRRSKTGSSGSAKILAQCCGYIETPSYTFTLPNFSEHDDEFRKFLEKNLIESSTCKTLEGSGHLNWWAENNVGQKLWPLATTGDGNCLLHAASLAMWGFHDRLLMLRKALHFLLTKGSRRHALWRRWRWHQTQQNNEYGLIFNEDEWQREWDSVIRLASTQPRSKPTSAEPLSNLNSTISGSNANVEPAGDVLYESLEEIHVFALAHVLKRPIIVVADTVLRSSGGEAFAPINFGGIYLPLECCPDECHRSPLLLCYDAGHFSALVPMQMPKTDCAAADSADQISIVNNQKKFPVAVIPVTDKQRHLLPLHFSCDPGADFTWWADVQDSKIADAAVLGQERRFRILAQYVDLVKLPCNKDSSDGSRKKMADGNNCTSNSSWAAVVRFATHKLTPRERRSATIGVIPRSGSGGDSSASSSRVVLDNGARWRGSTGSISGADTALGRTARLRRTAANWLGAGNSSSSGTGSPWTRLARSLKRRLRASSQSNSGGDRITNSKTRCSATIPRCNVVDEVDSVANVDGENAALISCLSVNDLRDQWAIVGAKLHTEARHQFMQEMIDNYLKAARQRFDAADRSTGATTTTSVIATTVQTASSSNNHVTSGPGVATSNSGSVAVPVVASVAATSNNSTVVATVDPNRRERLSRSFSATSVVVRCMNDNCDGQGSHQTNFLCDLCFKTQKRLMESFTTVRRATCPSPNMSLNSSATSSVCNNISNYSKPSLDRGDAFRATLARSILAPVVQDDDATTSTSAPANGCRSPSVTVVRPSRMGGGETRRWRASSRSYDATPQAAVTVYRAAVVHDGDETEAAALARCCDEQCDDFDAAASELCAQCVEEKFWRM